MTVLELLAAAARARIITADVTQRIDVRLPRSLFLLVEFVRPWPFGEGFDDIVERRHLFADQSVLSGWIAAGEQFRQFLQRQPFLGDPAVFDQLRRFGVELLIPEN